MSYDATVYVIVNSANDRQYIGVSANIKHRHYSHLLSLKNGKHSNKELQKDYDLHGKSVFSFSDLFSTIGCRLTAEREEIRRRYCSGISLYNRKPNIERINKDRDAEEVRIATLKETKGRVLKTMIFKADMIPALIAKIGWSQVELAAAVGASPQQMTKWMKGRGSKKLQRNHREAFIAVCTSHCLTEEDLAA